VKRLVVVGAGISGLAAAHAAAERLGERASQRAGDAAVDIVVLESAPTVGGKARTRIDREWTVEAGPAGFLLPDPAIERLIRIAGLEPDVLPSDAAAAHRFLVRGGQLREVSAHPLRFVTSGILDAGAMLRLLREPWVPARQGGDESVWEFARRRLGPQAADRLVAPMVLGIFAGDAKRLSLPAAFPRLAALEHEHGSLVRGMMAQHRRAKNAARAADGAAEAGSGDGAGLRGRLTSFTDGLEALPRALVRDPLHVRCEASVERVERGAAGELWLHLDGESMRADALILACEAWAAASIVGELAPGLARVLAQIAYPPVAVVALGFDAAAARGVPRGFGVLIPRGEGYRVLGVLWDSHIFPGRSPDGTLLVRAMLGGAVDPAVGSADASTLVELTRDELRRLLAIEAPPLYSHVHLWPRAIPQYELGHGDRVRRIEAELVRQPGLFLAGNALHGIAFARAAAAGLAAGDAAAAFIERDSSVAAAGVR
jgi:oxygen-dependent protoporphyrinogen oxidase